MVKILRGLSQVVPASFVSQAGPAKLRSMTAKQLDLKVTATCRWLPFMREKAKAGLLAASDLGNAMLIKSSS